MKIDWTKIPFVVSIKDRIKELDIDWDEVKSFTKKAMPTLVIVMVFFIFLLIITNMTDRGDKEISASSYTYLDVVVRDNCPAEFEQLFRDAVEDDGITRDEERTLIDMCGEFEAHHIKQDLIEKYK